MVKKISNLEIKDIAATNLSDKDCKLLMDMYAKGQTIDDVLKIFKDRTAKGLRYKISRKKKLEKQTVLDAIIPKKK
jgi:hypothetical protein